MTRLRAMWSGLGRDVRTAVSLFFFSRLGLLLVGWFGTARLTDLHRSFVQYVTPQPLVFLDVWVRWDAFWYLKIANHGYSGHSYAFFPLLPILIHLTTPLFLGVDYVAGLVVTNLAFILALIVLYRLVAREHGDRLAERTVLYLILFPTAYFYSAIYTEPLFLLFTLLAFYWARQERWFLAGLAGGLSALTRNEGILLLLPLVWEYYERRGFRWRRTGWNVLGLGLIPLGFFSYLFWLYVETGNPFAFIHAQKSWGRHLQLPYESLILAWKNLSQHGYLTAHFVLTSIDLTATLLFAFLAIMGLVQKLPFSYVLYILYELLIPMSAPDVHGLSPLLSMSRFVVVLFPGFLVLAKLADRHPSVDRLVTITFPLIQSLFFVFFFTWTWLA